MASYRMTAATTLQVLKRPRYGLLAVTLSLAFFLVLRYLFSLQVLATIVTSSAVSTLEKASLILFGFLPDSIGEFITFLIDPVGLLLFIVALLQGVTVTVLIFVRRRANRRQATRGAASGFTVSLLGSGCIACGGSILYPLLASLGSQAAVTLSQTIGVIAGVLAVVLIIYALRNISAQAAVLLAHEG